MKKSISPATALVAIFLTLSAAGYALWYFGLRERPRPEHVGLPHFLQKMEDGRNADFKKKLAEQEAKKAAKASGSSKSKAGAPADKGGMASTSDTPKQATSGTKDGQ